MSGPTIAVDLRALVGTPSGIGFYTLALLDQLAASGWARYLGLAHAPVHGAERLARRGAELEYRSAPLGVLWQQLYLPVRLRRGDVDLLWSPLLTLPLDLSVPGVVTVHDLTAVLYPETHRLRVKLSIIPFLGRTLEQARGVVADSRATARDIAAQFPHVAGKIRVVYPGVDPDFRPGEPADIETTRESLGCPSGYILFVGTLEPRKNLGVLLDAWEGLRQHRSDTPPLVVAGAYGWKSRRLLARIRRLADRGLVYLDHVDRQRLVRLFQAARVLVLPSLYEGFGLPAAEAMACGIPTIVSNSSSLPEVIGDGGLTFPAEDADELARVLAQVLTDPARAREMGLRGLAGAAAFDWRRAAAEMQDIFREALR